MSSSVFSAASPASASPGVALQHAQIPAKSPRHSASETTPSAQPPSAWVESGVTRKAERERERERARESVRSIITRSIISISRSWSKGESHVYLVELGHPRERARAARGAQLAEAQPRVAVRVDRREEPVDARERARARALADPLRRDLGRVRLLVAHGRRGRVLGLDAGGGVRARRAPRLRGVQVVDPVARVHFVGRELARDQRPSLGPRSFSAAAHPRILAQSSMALFEHLDVQARDSIPEGTLFVAVAVGLVVPLR